MRVHGTFSTDTQTRLVGTWEFRGAGHSGFFRFWADGSRTYLTGAYLSTVGVLHLAGLKTRIYGRFTRTA